MQRKMTRLALTGRCGVLRVPFENWAACRSPKPDFAASMAKAALPRP